MTEHATFAGALEFKFANADQGTFEGYASVFGNQDSHGDVVLPGCFDRTIGEHKTANTMPAMFVNHGPAFGGDALPAGVWRTLSPDSKGLQVEGKISALDTDYGKRTRALMQDGALPDMSIGFRVYPGGSSMGKKPGEPRRSLKSVHLNEISLVTTGSNGLSKIMNVKAATSTSAQTDTAKASLVKAMLMHDKMMSGSGYYSDGGAASAKDKAVMMSHLQDAHEALDGKRVPDEMSGWKGAPMDDNEFMTLLVNGGFTADQAAHLMHSGFKSFAEKPVETKAQDSDMNEMMSLARLLTAA